MRKGMMVCLVLVSSIFLAIFGVNQSYAYLIENGWTFNLSAVHSGLTNATNVDRLTVDGTATVNQSFGSDGIFNDGDTFTEGALLQSVSYWTEPGVPGNLHTFDLTDDNGQTYTLYLYGAGLTGSVYDVTGSGPSDWEFKYRFDSGVGTLAMYLDTDADPTNGVDATLATFSIISPSGGQGPAGFLGGAGQNGTSDVTAIFTSAYPGVWQTSSGLDFSNFPPGLFGIGLLNTNNRVIDYISTANGFTTTIYSSGELNVAVIPEPTTLFLLGSGLIGLAGIGRRKMKK